MTAEFRVRLDPEARPCVTALCLRRAVTDSAHCDLHLRALLSHAFRVDQAGQPRDFARAMRPASRTAAPESESELRLAYGDR